MRLVETPKSVPQYEVRVRNHSVGDTEIEVWEMPSPASPQLKLLFGLPASEDEILSWWSTVFCGV